LSAKWEYYAENSVHGRVFPGNCVSRGVRRGTKKGNEEEKLEVIVVT
jgi:hypothetical protein